MSQFEHNVTAEKNINKDVSAVKTILEKKFENKDVSDVYNSQSFLKSFKIIGNRVFAIVRSESKGELTNGGKKMDIKSNRLSVLDENLETKYTSLTKTFYEDKNDARFSGNETPSIDGNLQNEYLEVVGIKDNLIEVLCADGSTATLEIPKELLD